MTKMGVAHAGAELTTFLLGLSGEEFEKRMKKLDRLGKVEIVEGDRQEKETEAEKKFALLYSKGKELGEGEEAKVAAEKAKASAGKEKAAAEKAVIGRAKRK
jgi:hypothetical protein